MTPKQTRFAQEYLIDLNARQAARRAGYTDASATNAYRLLSHPGVAAAVAEAKAERADALGVTAERVIAEFARIAFANMANYVRFDAENIEVFPIWDLTQDQTAAIAEITESKTQRGGTVRIKLHDKMAALNALARHIGLGQADRLVGAPDREADDAGPPDAYAIAREIAFALRQGQAAERKRAG